MIILTSMEVSGLIFSGLIMYVWSVVLLIMCLSDELSDED